MHLFQKKKEKKSTVIVGNLLKQIFSSSEALSSQ